MADYEFGDWLIDGLRATAFYEAGLHDGADRQWWDKVVGRHLLESADDRPADGLVTYTGVRRGERRLVMEFRTDRVDWFVRRESSPDRPGELRLAGLEPAVPSEFLSTVRAWLEVFRPHRLKRLAFGASLDSQVATMEDGIAELGEILKVGRDLPSERASDFIFRINRPRTSEAVSGVLINRLSAWSVMQFGFLDITLGPGAPSQQVQQVAGFARRLELDINTARENEMTQAAVEGYGQLFAELVALGDAIAREGDIA